MYCRSRLALSEGTPKPSDLFTGFAASNGLPFHGINCTASEFDPIIPFTLGFFNVKAFVGNATFYISGIPSKFLPA